MLRILIAPNSFKGSLTAEEVAIAIEEGILKSSLKAELVKFPIADGGDHTSFLLTKHLHGEMRSLTVAGAYGDQTKAEFGLIRDGKAAVIEVAETSGFKSINGPVKTPLVSTTKGLGQLINHCIELGVKEIIVCLGGSATVDGGIGMLEELGVKFKNNNTALKNINPKSFSEVTSIDASSLQYLIEKCKFTVLCDVENPLLGKDGAARVFGPQKGASERDVKALEDFLTHFNSLTIKSIGKSLADVDSGGAAGGLSASLHIYLNGNLLKGAEFFCEITGLKAELQKADLLITGEGSIDEQSLKGKAPIVVAKQAANNQIPVIGIAGKIPKTIDNLLQKYFNMLISIGNQPETLEEAINNTRENLKRTAQQIGNILAVSRLNKFD